ncbi:MAG: HIT domain-containing protein [Candidatus Cloacimonetes bacterium]|nr:HIT domain-containing protein [Candidatus Cloacimonadota bacterium]
MHDNILYSPWRMKYIISEKSKSCIFCFDKTEKRTISNSKEDVNFEHSDEDHLIVYRSKHVFVILNLYPYNNGHIMVVPNKHVKELSEMNKDELFDLIEVVQLSEKVIKNVYNPDGINIGMNLGKSAGAGIDEHLHVHILPRWSGDVNFMSSIMGTRVIPEDFSNTYHKIKEGFDNERPKK